MKISSLDIGGWNFVSWQCLCKFAQADGAFSLLASRFRLIMSTSDASPDLSNAQSTSSTTQGVHVICELYGATSLDEVDFVAETLGTMARVCGATILESRLHPFEDSGGVTGVVLLAESHITIHTWPEHEYAAVDIFMAGECDPEAGLPVLKDAFSPEMMQHATFTRGRPSRGQDGKI